MMYGLSATASVAATASPSAAAAASRTSDVAPLTRPCRNTSMTGSSALGRQRLHVHSCCSWRRHSDAAPLATLPVDEPTLPVPNTATLTLEKPAA